jgi:hypothetical protein
VDTLTPAFILRRSFHLESTAPIASCVDWDFLDIPDMRAGPMFALLLIAGHVHHESAIFQRDT